MVNVSKQIHINIYYETCYKRNVIRLKTVDTSIHITLVTLLISIFSIFWPSHNHFQAIQSTQECEMVFYYTDGS